MRGVNKRVVEVTNTGNDYIERAILFVRGDKLGTDADVLDYQVRLYLRELGAAPKEKEKGRRRRKFPRHRRLWLAVRLCAAAISGAGLVMLIQQLCKVL